MALEIFSPEMFPADPDVLDFVGARVDGLVATIVDARERELERRRVEACADEIVAEAMLRRTPRWRWLARAVWRRRHRLALARCLASGAREACVKLREGHSP